MSGSGTGFKAAHIIIDGADSHQFMVGPDAFAAKDTLAQVPDDKRICLFIGFVIGHGVKIRFTHPQLSCNPSQLAAVSFTAENAGLGMFCDHQADDVATMFDDAGVGGLNNHVRGCGGDTGSHETSGFFIFHQTHAAGAERFQLRMVTESGNFYAILVGSLQNTRFGRTGDSLAVNAQSDGFQLTHSQPGKAGIDDRRLMIDDLLMSLQASPSATTRQVAQSFL
jgi:hypothetical protein